jgi:hypothetical protein
MILDLMRNGDSRVLLDTEGAFIVSLDSYLGIVEEK